MCISKAISCLFQSWSLGLMPEAACPAVHSLHRHPHVQDNQSSHLSPSQTPATVANLSNSISNYPSRSTRSTETQILERPPTHQNSDPLTGGSTDSQGAVHSAAEYVPVAMSNQGEASADGDAHSIPQNLRSPSVLARHLQAQISARLPLVRGAHPQAHSHHGHSHSHSHQVTHSGSQQFVVNMEGIPIPISTNQNTARVGNVVFQVPGPTGGTAPRHAIPTANTTPGQNRGRGQPQSEPSVLSQLSSALLPGGAGKALEASLPFVILMMVKTMYSHRLGKYCFSRSTFSKRFWLAFTCKSRFNGFFLINVFVCCCYFYTSVFMDSCVKF